MLRKRSRAVSSSKQTIVSDHKHSNNRTKINFPSPNLEKLQNPTSFLINSPRIIKDFFTSKDYPQMSPSSVLDTKPFSYEKPGIGLALIDDHKYPQIGPTTTNKSSKQRTKLVVFGSHLKIQIPPLDHLPLTSPQPQSPMEFGIKTPKSNLLGHVFANSTQLEEGFYNNDNKKLSVKDMELSEDYTCVISHGPNPKTTHIFGNCIIKSCCAAISNTNPSTNEDYSFLSFCHHCNNKIGQGKDIYMYRGEKAFCSQECRGQEMLFDGVEC